MSATVYDLYGLRVESQIPLYEHASQKCKASDVIITLDGSGTARDTLDINAIAGLASGGRIHQDVLRGSRGEYLMHIPGLCDFEISADLSMVHCFPRPDVDLEWITILLRGLVLAMLLELRGTASLHASAVEFDGQIVAFAGASGSGKSTTAALLCAAGGRLVADDVLCLDMHGDGVRCYRGSQELRLRDKAMGLLDDQSWVLAKRRLVDGRLAVRPRYTEHDVAPLSAVVLARPWRSGGSPEIRRLRPSEAVFRLAAVPRISGWTCPDVRRRAFLDTARLADEIPVFEAGIPWGPPWRPSEALGVLAGLSALLA